MVKYSILFFALFQISLLSQNELRFTDFFHDQTLRIDFIFNSNYEEDNVSISGVYSYNSFNGNPKYLIDPNNLGKYFLKLFDAESRKLIYSRGFTGLVSEYKVTDEALKGVKKEFQQTLLIPRPKLDVILEIHRRKKDNKLEKIFSKVLNSTQKFEAKRYNGKTEAGSLINNGDPKNKVDLVFVSEGYREKNIFMDDVERYTNVLFNNEPFMSRKMDFNIHFVFAIPADTSNNILFEDSGFKTAANSNFNTLGMKGYLGTDDIFSLRDITGNIPCDHIIVLVKSERFGGNGIYNHFCFTTTDHKNSEKVFLHEFGHSFGGLADEYYEDFYSGLHAEYYFPPDIEPLEPNITILAHADKIKWRHLLTEDVDIPTKWDKELLDSMQIDLIKKQIEIERELKNLEDKNLDSGIIGEKRSGLFASLKGDADKFRKLYSENMEKFEGVIGAFEGAAHFVKGFYRPSFICLMNKTSYTKFCAVCQNAFIKIINYYSR